MRTHGVVVSWIWPLKTVLLMALSTRYGPFFPATRACWPLSTRPWMGRTILHTLLCSQWPLASMRSVQEDSGSARSKTASLKAPRQMMYSTVLQTRDEWLASKKEKRQSRCCTNVVVWGRREEAAEFCRGNFHGRFACIPRSIYIYNY